MINVNYKFYFLQFYVYYVYAFISEPLKHAHFSITKDSIYIPQSASSFLVNISGNTVQTKEDCTIKCLNHEKCHTAIYYQETTVCSLFREKSDVGQIVNGLNQTSFVMTITNRTPTSKYIDE